MLKSHFYDINLTHLNLKSNKYSKKVAPKAYRYFNTFLNFVKYNSK